MTRWFSRMRKAILYLLCVLSSSFYRLACVFMLVDEDKDIDVDEARDRDMDANCGYACDAVRVRMCTRVCVCLYMLQRA